MGHPTHFLQRLDRAGAGFVDRALDLYRNPDLVSLLVAGHGDHERVAVSLAPDNEGPYVVVTHRGDFVTCLARGMGIEGLGLIPFERLESVTQGFQLYRRHTGERGAAGILTKLMHMGPHVSREDLQVITLFQPLIQPRSILLFLDTYSVLETMTSRMSKLKKVRKAHREALTQYWRTHYALGHLLLLVTYHGREGLGELYDSMGEHPLGGGADTVGQGWTLPWLVGMQSDTALAVRAAWSVARMGKPLLASYKRRFADAAAPVMLVDAALGLLALGLRHKKLRQEIHKYLTSTRRFPSRVIDYLQTLRPETGDILLTMLVEGRDDEIRLLGEAYARELLWDDAGPRLGYSSPDEVPTAIAMAYAANVSIDLVGTPSGLEHVLLLLPWLARADALDLYLPQGVLARLAPPTRIPEAGLGLLHSASRAKGRRFPKRREVKVGRNDPCPCGSGKKYKHCCGI